MTRLIVSLDLKPSNILLLLSDIDTIVMHELAERPSELHEFPKTTPPDRLPFHAVTTNPLPFDLDMDQAQDTEFHWVIADLGHGTLLYRAL